jgi:hypothetical protein
MHNLTEFNKRLQRDYPRYRVRYSQFRDSYIIEVKMGTGYWNVDTSYDEDTKTQIMDGYVEWGEVTLGDRKKCYHCTNTVKVPVREFREHKCDWCGMTQPTRAYFELNDDLLYHFNKLRNRRVSTADMKAHNSSIADRNLDRSVDDAAYLARENSHLLYGNPRSIGRKIDWHNLDVIT